MTDGLWNDGWVAVVDRKFGAIKRWKQLDVVNGTQETAVSRLVLISRPSNEH